MHKNNVCVIYDSDTKYAMKLMNVINSDKQVPFGAQVFTEKEQLNSYLADYEPKILMISEDICHYDFVEKKGEEKKGTQLVVLCNEENQAERAQEQYGEEAIGVYKYQSSNRILQKIIHQGKDDEKEISTKTQFIGITGAEVCSRNLLGLTLAHLFGEKRSVLYVNLDEFSGLDHILGAENNNNLSDAFYLYKQNGFRYCDEIRRTINHTERMDYIAPVQCAEDISYMEAVRVAQFLYAIGEELGYEMVLVDVSSGVRASWHILEKCNYIYMPQSEQDWIRRKQNAMEQYFLETGMGYLVDKIVRISFRTESELMVGDFWSQLDFYHSTQEIKEAVEQQISGDAG